jgi:hypothetical protein
MYLAIIMGSSQQQKVYNWFLYIELFALFALVIVTTKDIKFLL